MNNSVNDGRHGQVAELLAIHPEQAVRQAIGHRFPGVGAIGRSVPLHPLNGWSAACAADVLHEAVGRRVAISASEVNSYCGRIDDLVDFLDCLITRQLHDLYAANR